MSVFFRPWVCCPVENNDALKYFGVRYGYHVIVDCVAYSFLYLYTFVVSSTVILFA